MADEGENPRHVISQLSGCRAVNEDVNEAVVVADVVNDDGGTANTVVGEGIVVVIGGVDVVVGSVEDVNGAATDGVNDGGGTANTLVGEDSMVQVLLVIKSFS